MNTFVILFLAILACLYPSFAAPKDIPKDQGPPAPRQVHGERQDFQAARITWKPVKGKNVRYFLYASYDEEPFAFHKENNGKPFADTFAIWDAPRQGLRRFVFYVTAVDANGHESPPSAQVHVDLGPLPH